MLCEKCGEREATVHMVQSINGNYRESHVCQPCAGDMGALTLPFSMADMLQSLSGLRVNRGLVCDTCGLSFQEFQRTGMLGCPDCYSQFGSELLPMVSAIHGGTTHRGRTSYVLTEEEKRDTRLDALRKDLGKAVLEERYEDAAGLRDAIKALEEGKANGSES